MNTDIKSITEAFRDMRLDYIAAKGSRYRSRPRGVSPAGSGADYHVRLERDFLGMIELARHFDRNNMLVGQGIDRLVDNVIQGGLAFDAQTGDEILNKDLEARWREWGEDPKQCDVSTRFNFHDMERLVLRQTVVDGDVFCIPLKVGSLEIVEAHRCRTPSNTSKNVSNGVLLDNLRRPRQYWFTKDDIDTSTTLRLVSEIQTYPADEVFHIADPKRFSQTRGITTFAPIADVLGIHDDLQFAKLVQAQMVSCIAFLRIRDQMFSGGLIGSTGSSSLETLSDGTQRLVEAMAPGMELRGLPGEKIEGFSPNVPNPEFFPHVMLVLTIVAVNLHMPVAVLLLDPSETNFSGWRGAVDQARLTFKRMQEWEAAKFHRRVYLWKLGQWIAADPALRSQQVRNDVNLCGHRWNPPTWPYIQPVEDAKGDLLRIGGLLTSPRRLHAERGHEWQEIVDETVMDNAYAIIQAKEGAIAINTQFAKDDPIDWRELLCLPTPENVSRTLAEKKEGTTPDGPQPQDTKRRPS